MIAVGAHADTAKFIWDEAAFYYHQPLTPYPDDRWESTMRIDPGDLEDITAKYWKQQGWVEPHLKNPVVIPSDPTLLEYALWLDTQRQLQE